MERTHRIDAVVGRFADFVTTHNRLVIVVMLVLTAGVAVGVAQDSGEADGTTEEEIGEGTEVFDSLEYLEANYASEEDENDTAVTTEVYVRDDSSVLTRDGLLTALEYQLEVTESESVTDVLADEDSVDGPPNIVGTHLAEESEPDLETQRAAIAEASDEELEAAIEETLADEEYAGFYLPTAYEPGSGDAEAMRLTFEFDTAEETEFGTAGPADAQETLFETAADYDDPEVFTQGQFAFAELNQEFLSDTIWLVLPPILLMLVIVLGFAYRDVTDVLIGLVGSIVALLWTFGLMGWLGLLNQSNALIVPVLIAALSIDFGFHVFMRYRERRGTEEGIRSALSRSTGAVAVAFVLVTITAAIGFLSNLTNPVPLIRDLGIAITLGVIAALIIFTTLVPALKVSADGLWERFGYNRRKTALGKGRYLQRILGGSVVTARRGAIAVVGVALVVSLAGGVAFAELDREQFQQTDFTEDPGWQSELPGPMAYEAHESETAQQLAFVEETFQSDTDGAAEGGTGFTQILIRGEPVATEEGMATVAAGHEAANDADDEIILHRGGEVPVESPLTVLETAAAEDDDLAAALDEADTTGDGVPDENVAALFDQLFEVAPEQAETVIERSDGEYESMVLAVPAQAEFGDDRAEAMFAIEDEMDAESGHTVTAVGTATLGEVAVSEISDGIVTTMVLALAGVLVVLSLVYRVTRGSATLGAVTVLPIALALGLVFGGMYVFDQPITPLTALLVSILIGLGIDYNIHVSDRFAQELRLGNDVETALRETVTGTGGALLGSAVTSTSAFALLIIIPEAQLTSFGVIVALALGASFLLSVFVLPSLLYLWAERTDIDTVRTQL